eukprot:g9292.t1
MHFSPYPPACNQRVLDVIVEAANLRRYQDTVLEVGPGTGALTVKLLANARQVVAIDVEESMLRETQFRAEALGLLKPVIPDPGSRGDHLQDEGEHAFRTATGDTATGDTLEGGLFDPGHLRPKADGGGLATCVFPPPQTHQLNGNKSNLQLYKGDILRQTPTRRFDAVVANLPYKISTPFVLYLLGLLCSPKTRWRTAVLMFQSEFADRLLAD